MGFNERDILDPSYLLESIDSLTEGIEMHFESVSRSLKDTFRASPWLPDSMKPRPPPPPPRRMAALPMGYFEASRIWISEHRTVIAALVAFVGTGAFTVWRRRKVDRAKRRAKRASNGSRCEVIVLAGSPHSPLTRSLSLEFERRGFIVYIPVNSLSEEQIIQSESRPDIRPLNLDITSPEATEEAIRKFTQHITTPRRPIPNTTSHTSNLVSFVLVPGPILPLSPIASISSSTWSDNLNNRLLAPFTILQAFLPLINSQKSSILFLTPSTIPSLSPPSHAAESVVAGGLQQYISTLRKEVQSQGVNIVQFKLGQFEFGVTVEDHQQQLVLSQHISVAEATRKRLEQKNIIAKKAQGTSLRELHNGLFDAIVRGKGRNGAVFVGRGARTYDLVGKWVPGGIVGWMMGAVKSSPPAPAPAPVRSERCSSADANAEWDKVGARDSDEEPYVYPKQI